MVTYSYVGCNIQIILYQRIILAFISLIFRYISDAARKLFFITEEKTYYVTTLGRKNRNSLITDISLSSCCITKNTFSHPSCPIFHLYFFSFVKGVSNSLLEIFVWKTRNKFARISCVVTS